MLSDLSIWWCGLEQGEKASWVQAWGSIIAIGVTAFLAGYAEISRRLQERRQAVIYYKIARDTFVDVVSIIETADVMADTVSPRDAVAYLRAAAEDRMPGNIDILQQTMMTPLPNSRAAKDVQLSRTYTYEILAKMKDVNKWAAADRKQIHGALENVLRVGRSHRDRPRTSSGPWQRPWWNFWGKPD